MNILEQVKSHKLIAIFRKVPANKAVQTAQALYDGGVRLLEVTFDQSSSGRLKETSQIIETVSAVFRDRMQIGAGTVMSIEEVKAANCAGASFLLSPNIDPKVIYVGKELGMGVIPGALTPTEIACAFKYGADIVKLFPADSLGTGYIKAVRAPISHIPLLVVGGINELNMKDYLAAGAVGAGVGSNIVNNQLIMQDDFAQITALAKKYMQAIQ